MNTIINKIYSKGKALYIDDDTMFIAKGYNIYRSNINDKKLIFDGTLIDSKYTFMSKFSRMLNRLLRIEPSTMLLLQNGSRLISAKKGIFIAPKGSQKYIKVFSLPRGNKPLNIALNPDNGDLYFGEYILNGRFADTQRSEVHIYKSEDHGLSWNICYSFPKNTIRHIHGIFYDKYTKKMWISTGDRDNECLIASSSDGFKSLDILKQGKQKYRAVTLLFYKEFIVYGTDTEHEKNYIYSINRENKEETCLQELQGSVLMATQNSKGEALLSTAVEPSKINQHSYAHVWYSYNGLEWKNIYAVKKDIWSAKYFQYGRISFPYNAIKNKNIYFSGHALKKIDNTIIHLINL